MRLIAHISLCMALTGISLAQAQPGSKEFDTQQEFGRAVELYRIDPIQAKAKIYRLFKAGKTPELWALVYAVRSRGGDNGVTYMLEHHADQISNSSKSEALFDTAINQPLLGKLIKAGADVNYFHPKYHYTVIQRASTMAPLTTVKALLAAGAIPKAFRGGKWMPISQYLKLKLEDSKKSIAILSKLPNPTEQDKFDLMSAKHFRDTIHESIALFEEAEKTHNSAVLTQPVEQSLSTKRAQ